MYLYQFHTFFGQERPQFCRERARKADGELVALSAVQDLCTDVALVCRDRFEQFPEVLVGQRARVQPEDLRALDGRLLRRSGFFFGRNERLEAVENDAGKFFGWNIDLPREPYDGVLTKKGLDLFVDAREGKTFHAPVMNAMIAPARVLIFLTPATIPPIVT